MARIGTDTEAVNCLAVARIDLEQPPGPSSTTYMTPPVGAAAMPNGCEANGMAIVRITARFAGSMTLMVALSLLVTQTSPFGAMATARGAMPTAISATLVFVAVSKTLTESLSWFTTHNRSLAGRDPRRRDCRKRPAGSQSAADARSRPRSLLEECHRNRWP